MALTQTQVSQLYISIFNRASEGEGNSYWQATGKNMATTANTMLATADAKAYFGTSLDTNQAFIEHIYLNTLGKTYAQDTAGVDYWVGRLNNGESKGDIIAALITAAQSTANAGDAQDAFNNKVAVSDYAAQKLETAGTDLTSFQNLIKNVTADASTVTKSKQAIDAEANSAITGDTQYLSVSQDIKTGTAGNDAFISYVAQNQNGQQVNTLGSGDVINGGAGSDTLDAQVTTGAYVNGGATSNMAIAPITTSVENVILHAEIADIAATAADNNDTVVVNAKYMNGVETIASNYSDASLVIQNMTTKGVSGGTAAQTVAMEYTGNADTNWDESNMTVFYDQDYLVRSAVESNSLYYFTQDRLATQEDNKPFGANTAVDGIKFRIDGTTEVVVKIAEDKLDAFLANVPANGIEAYQAFADLLSEALAVKNAELNGALDGFEITLDSTYYRTNGGKDNGGDPLDQYAYAIVLTAPDNVEIDQPAMNQNTKFLGTYDMYNDVSAEKKASDTSVSINVDLEKVGLAADGGALTIGSMNKDHNNTFNTKQAITVTDTLAGFDEFNVSVAGDKSKNSSLSTLESTDNTLRKVTIDSKVGSNANLIIGNSNTVDNGGNDVTLDSSANNAHAFKDVQIMDASTFAGDLTLNAGFTSEIVEKYLNNVTETTLYGLNDAKTELATFDYNGGAGNDTLNLALDLDNIVTANFTDANDTNGLNVFKMDINGGNGDDTIIVDADDVSSASTATNITIDGGLGDDLIDISSNSIEWTYNVAFSGTHFGHDVVKGFDEGIVTVTDEAQTLDLAGFVAHNKETIVVTVGDKSMTFNVTGDMDDAAIAAQVADMLDAADPQYPTVHFTTATPGSNAGVDDHIIALAKTDANVNSVTVEVKSQVESTGTYDKDTTPIHTATSTTQQQGGLVESDTPAEGADTLDFSAYNVAGVVIELGTGVNDKFGTNAGLNTTPDADIFTLTGENKFIYLEASAHDSNIYNVYMATSKAGNVGDTDIDFTATTSNATKGAVIGSINLQDATGQDINVNGLDASQLLF
jgi:hypothetical protein